MHFLVCFEAPFPCQHSASKKRQKDEGTSRAKQQPSPAQPGSAERAWLQMTPFYLCISLLACRTEPPLAWLVALVRQGYPNARFTTHNGIYGWRRMADGGCGTLQQHPAEQIRACSPLPRSLPFCPEPLNSLVKLISTTCLLTPILCSPHYRAAQSSIHQRPLRHLS